MVKFPTPGGIATVTARPAMVSECRKLEQNQAAETPRKEEHSGEETVREGATEEVLVNPAFPEQKVTIGKGLSEEGRKYLIELLRRNKDVFAWQPSDMTGIPRRLIRHHLNVNVDDTPIAQKRRTFSAEKNQVIMTEVDEWLKARIVRPVRYPTWISNPVLVKKCD